LNKSIKSSQLKNLFALKTVKTSTFLIPLKKFFKTTTLQIYSNQINNFKNQEIFFKKVSNKTISLFAK